MTIYQRRKQIAKRQKSRSDWEQVKAYVIQHGLTNSKFFAGVNGGQVVISNERLEGYSFEVAYGKVYQIA